MGVGCPREGPNRSEPCAMGSGVRWQRSPLCQRRRLTWARPATRRARESIRSAISKQSLPRLNSYVPAQTTTTACKRGSGAKAVNGAVQIIGRPCQEGTTTIPRKRVTS